MRWITCRPGFFLPVRVLSRLFRRPFLEHLQSAFPDLSFFAELAGLTDPSAFNRCLAELRRIDCRVDGNVAVPIPGHRRRSPAPVPTERSVQISRTTPFQ
jgi:hypothetical protein